LVKRFGLKGNYIVSKFGVNKMNYRKMITKLIVLLILLVSVGLLGWYILMSNNNPVNLAERVVSNYFKYWNDKNVVKLDETLVPKRRGIDWELDKLDFVKLISIRDEKYKLNNTKIYNVIFVISFKNGEGSGLSNGIHSWEFTLSSENESSPWLISDWGEG
jgi:hypothetical protein